MIALLVSWAIGTALGSLFMYRLDMRQRNIAGLRADRVWFLELGWSSSEARQHDKVKLDLATVYVRRNWWWTSRVRVYTEDIDARVQQSSRS